MEIVTGVLGPLQTNVHLVADPRTREAIVIDTAIPGLRWITDALTARGWRLLLVVSTHGHWDHTGENAALQAWSREREAASAEAGAAAPVAGASESPPGDRLPADPLARHVVEHGLAVVAPDGREHRPDPARGAEIAAHPADWYRLLGPQPLYAPFAIPPCVPAAELAEGGVVSFGEVRLDVLHTPGHTEGSVCLVSHEAGVIFSGDTLFPGGWGRVDFPGGDAEAMVESLRRLATLPDALRVLPGHGRATTIGAERPWLELVVREGRLPL
ncbi:MAG TPA: MBL fold metallo-hydrolase [Patescibacteria group bacterium]|nr:MBL fold metallo-hydrolase [Patescibacteria group bacterium]